MSLALAPAGRLVLRAVLAAAAAALLALLLLGSHGQASLTSASAPFSGSSPATTVAPAPTTTTTLAPANSPTAAHTGEAWSSAWYGWVLGGAVIAGLVCLQPLLTRRERLL
ncbi:MAG TPA: hypothetical protein VE991_03815 [Acidimicrobiales bacterium]|nr:hypothetical protein [Acidimicrobiales bacterium]